MHSMKMAIRIEIGLPYYFELGSIFFPYCGFYPYSIDVYGRNKFHQYIYMPKPFLESLAPDATSPAEIAASDSSLEVTYKPGKEMHLPGTLSRAYLNEEKEDLLDEELEVSLLDLEARAANFSGKASRISRCHSARHSLTFISNIIHLMCAPSGNSEFCFPESLNVSRDEVEGNIETRGKTKLTISRGSTH